MLLTKPLVKVVFALPTLFGFLLLLPTARGQGDRRPGDGPPGKVPGDVELPKGDPIPDFVKPPWVPPSTDPGKMNKRGTDFGPALSFTVQLGKDTFVRRGLTVRLPRDQAVLYDLDTLSVAATWRGGFLDISQTHFEDNKGRLPGRPGGEPTLWVVNSPGWAGATGSTADPRKGGVGPLPAGQVEYRGHFLHGFRTVLSYAVLGRGVLEMPGVDEGAPAGCLCRTFYVSPGPAVHLVLKQSEGKPKLPQIVNVPAGQGRSLHLLKYGAKDGVAVGLVDAPAGVSVGVGGPVVVLTVPAADEPLRFKVAVLQGPEKDLPRLSGYVKKADAPADLRNYVRGGPRRWREDVTLKGKYAAEDGPYVVDDEPIPADNPWKAWVRPAAIDFFSDGRMAMSSMNGDVWLCTRQEGNATKVLRWQRHATGMYEPLGLKIVDDKLYVLGRDRITRLHDLDGDGEADYYQSFWAGGVVSPGYHAFSFELQTDSKGNFYFLKSGRKADDTPDHNALLKVAADGSEWEVVATGFRHPNGMGVGPADQIVVSDNQGEFVPCSQINWIGKGRYYGYGRLDPGYAVPLLCLPMSQDNSSGGELWAPKDWGPLGGKLLHTSYGTCKLFYVLTQFDAQGRQVQATAVPLDDLRFGSGIMRLRVNPADGQVYASGLRGWGTKAKKDGCLSRVRYTGQPAHMVADVRLVRDGLEISFTCPLDPASATDPDAYKLEQWNYVYSQKYGSPEMSVREPGRKGHDLVEVRGAVLGKGDRSVLLRVPELVPVDQLHTRLRVRAADGTPVEADLFSTVRRLPE